MVEDILVKLEIAREEGLEEEIGGPWKVTEEASTYVVIETSTGKYRVSLSSRDADARLQVEEYYTK